LEVVLAILAIIWLSIAGIFGISVTLEFLHYGIIFGIVFVFVVVPILIWVRRQAELGQIRTMQNRYVGC